MVAYAESQLEWSNEVCAQLGAEYAVFDYCAEIIFCEGTGDFRHDTRRDLATVAEHNENENDALQYHLRGSNANDRNLDGLSTKHDSGEPHGITSTSTSTATKSSYDEHEHSAQYGWRLANEGGSCSWPGPLIRLEPGTSYGLFVKGSSSSNKKVNLHIHGLHVSGHGNGDDIRRSVSGSDVILYNVTVPVDHMGGTFWYHSHYHGRSYSHLKGGAFGMAIVEDNTADSDTASASASSIEDDEAVQMFMRNEHRMVLANTPGLPGSFKASAASKHYSWNSDEWYRLRVLTMSIDSHLTNHNLEFLPVVVDGDEAAAAAAEHSDPCEIRAIAHDGVLRFTVPAEVATSKYSLNGASRIDLAIRCNADAHVSVGGTVVASISVSAAEATAKGTTAGVAPSPFDANGRAWKSKRPNYLSDLRQATVSETDKWSIKVGEHDMNGVNFSVEHTMCKSEYGGDFRYGTVNEWDIAPTMHPFHLHMYPMQVVSPEGCDAHEYGEFYDSLSYMSDYRNPNKPPCKVRMNFVDVGGLTALHCHMPQHEDQGSLALIDVKGDYPVQPNFPRVYKCHGDDPCDEPREIKECHA